MDNPGLLARIMAFTSGSPMIWETGWRFAANSPREQGPTLPNGKLVRAVRSVPCSNARNVLVWHAKGLRRGVCEDLLGDSLMTEEGDNG